MKYYLHDSNSFSDEKITELYLNFGYEGLGLFYTALEKLALQEKPIKTNVLKSQLNIGKKLDKCWNFIESIGLLSSNNGETFSKQLLNFSEKYQIKKEKNKERIKQWRDNQTDKENVTHYEQPCNTPKVNISKVKLNKVKESKVITPPSEFEFLDYCKLILKEKYEPLEFSLKAKFDSWIKNKWKDGNDKQIKNWQSKINNTIPYLKPMYNGAKQTNPNERKTNLDNLAELTERVLQQPFTLADNNSSDS